MVVYKLKDQDKADENNQKTSVCQADSTFSEGDVESKQTCEEVNANLAKKNCIITKIRSGKHFVLL